MAAQLFRQSSCRILSTLLSRSNLSALSVAAVATNNLLHRSTVARMMSCAAVPTNNLNLLNQQPAAAAAATITRFRSFARMMSSDLKTGPKKPKFPKQHRGTIKGISDPNNHICFGTYAIQALEPGWISGKQLEAGRRALTRITRRGGKLWIRVFPDKPVTGKPAQTRMGRGKGVQEYWVAVVKPGQVLYELGGVAEKIAKEIMFTASTKLSIRTRSIVLR